MSKAKGNKGGRRLGRGLDSLIKTPSTVTTPSTPEAAGRRVIDVAIEQIEPRDDQPRQHFDDAALAELAESIRERGVLQPILVQRKRGRYVIIAGERRWRACQRAGLKEVPVLVDDATDDEVLELALIENIQREDLNAIEEAEAYDRLIGTKGWTQAQLAERLGKDRSTITNALRLLGLPPTVRSHVVAGRLAMGHARALLALDDAGAIEEAARKVLAGGLSVRATEALVRSLRAPAKSETKKDAPAPMTPEVRDLVGRLERHLGTRVALKNNKGKGSLTIQYASLDELDRILARILPEDR